MKEDNYDVVIVGAGIAGAILAKELTEKKKRVLLLEAGKASDDYLSYLEVFYTALAKVPNSPYPDNPNAPSQNVLNLGPIPAGGPNLNGYMVQYGPVPFGSDFTRVSGGTTMHWLGHSFRMLPNDFKLHSKYGHGVDWPISYDDLKPFYEKSEWEIGVSADVEGQIYPGMGNNFFGKNYYYPMKSLPASYLDQKVAGGIQGMKVKLGKNAYPLSVITTPQGRNSTPNKGYKPIGASWDNNIGQRCEGNSNCVPICPVQAKYNALKTLNKADQKYLTVINQAVASNLIIDPETNRIKGVTYKQYQSAQSSDHTSHTVQGKIFIIAAHAVETAKLLLASNAANSSDLVGRCLMDHPTMLTWGLMPEDIGSYRGPGATSHIPTFRDGAFRKEHSAFIIPVDNWGWLWGEFSPGSDVTRAINQLNLFGKKLRGYLDGFVSRQFGLQFEFEQLPQHANRVTIDPNYLDQLGNYRPVVHYDISDYTRAAMEAAKGVSDMIFAKLGVEDYTNYSPGDTGYLPWKGTGYTFKGAGHLVGTHRMGKNKSDSVVDENQKSWDHKNLYLVGPGSMPTLGTSNPTLTVAALAFKSDAKLLKDLGN